MLGPLARAGSVDVETAENTREADAPRQPKPLAGRCHQKTLSAKSSARTDFCPRGATDPDLSPVNSPDTTVSFWIWQGFPAGLD